MKKLLIVALVFVLGCFTTQLLGQEVKGQSVLVTPKPYAVAVDVAVPRVVVQVQRGYVMVQPRPYLVTPFIQLPPPKPLFPTPFRDKIWRHKNKPRVNYIVTPQ